MIWLLRCIAFLGVTIDGNQSGNEINVLTTLNTIRKTYAAYALIQYCIGSVGIWGTQKVSLVAAPEAAMVQGVDPVEYEFDL